MNRARAFGWTVALLLITAAAVEARGAGLLVPEDKSLPPLAVKYLRVDVRVENQAAVTHVVQEFQNSTNSNLECTYIFPLPKGAAVSDFAMYVNGKRTKGELVEKEKARQIYEEIVRRTRDPGLLEYMDGSLLRMRIFPVPARARRRSKSSMPRSSRWTAGWWNTFSPCGWGTRHRRHWRISRWRCA